MPQQQNSIPRYALALITLAGSSCADTFDSTTLASPHLTLGAEIYNEVCNRVAFSEDPPLDSRRQAQIALRLSR